MHHQLAFPLRIASGRLLLLGEFSGNGKRGETNSWYDRIKPAVRRELELFKRSSQSTTTDKQCGQKMTPPTTPLPERAHLGSSCHRGGNLLNVGLGEPYPTAPPDHPGASPWDTVVRTGL